MSVPPPPAHDPKIERILLQTVPWEARKKGGTLLQECLKDLWEKAVRIGFNYGEENLAAAREEGFREGKEEGFKEGVESGRAETATSVAWEASKAGAIHKKELEAERVWGYDVGWRLCSEVLQVRAKKASVISPSTPCPRSLSVAATQTDPVAATPERLNWAEDAEVLPISTPHPPLPPSSARDFSALCTGISQSFASLQRRRRRSPRVSPSSHQSHFNRSRHTRSTVYHHPMQTKPSSSPYFSPSFRYDPPSSPLPSGRVPAQLDWDRDPRLRDLSRALTALGWVKL
ncbi:hypothetical protein B0H11DRAFT_2072633 [Mycena galericulata]|nr:hypothetical protein B0H11DRAFT_2072633 [Mycena galericulata]